MATSAAIAALAMAIGEETDPAKKASIIERHVLACCETDQPGDPTAGREDYLFETWRAAYQSLLDIRPVPWEKPAIRLISSLREKLLARQLQTGVRINTGVLSQFLTETHSNFERDETAFRWALHTQAADLLASHAGGGGLGRMWLFGYFGVSDAQRRVLDDAAIAATARGDWKNPGGFPEDVVRSLLRARPVGTELFSRFPLREEFPITRPYLEALWKYAQVTDLNTDERGKRFETIAEYLCSLLPGCVPMANVLDPSGAAQHDVVVANHSTSEACSADLFGRYFIVECKNCQNAASVSDIGYFLFRLRQAKCRVGIMLSRTGITGNTAEEKNARALVARTFRGDDVTCIIVTGEDIQSLISGTRTSFLSLLRTRLEEVRYGVPT